MNNCNWTSGTYFSNKSIYSFIVRNHLLPIKTTLPLVWSATSLISENRLASKDYNLSSPTSKFPSARIPISVPCSRLRRLVKMRDMDSFLLSAQSCISMCKAVSYLSQRTSMMRSLQGLLVVGSIICRSLRSPSISTLIMVNLYSADIWKSFNTSYLLCIHHYPFHSTVLSIIPPSHSVPILYSYLFECSGCPIIVFTPNSSPRSEIWSSFF